MESKKVCLGEKEEKRHLKLAEEDVIKAVRDLSQGGGCIATLFGGGASGDR